jgi:uncharacterized membrane protein
LHEGLRLMAASSSTQTSGIGVSGLLGVAFVVLKLTHVIDWSWWWVLAPFWVPFAILAVVVLIGGLIALAVKS